MLYRGRFPHIFIENEDMEETIMSSVNDLLKAIANRDYSQEYINEAK